jgi:hypothetical protein
MERLMIGEAQEPLQMEYSKVLYKISPTIENPHFGSEFDSFDLKTEPR